MTLMINRKLKYLRITPRMIHKWDDEARAKRDFQKIVDDFERKKRAEYGEKAND